MGGIREARIGRLEATYPREDILFAAEHLHVCLDSPSDDGQRAHHLNIDARNLSLRSSRMAETLPPWLGNSVPRFAASLRLENFPPLALDAATRDPAAFFERIRLERSAAHITHAELQWGELSLAGEGAFRIDGRRHPEGYFHLRIDEAEATLRALVSERYLSEEGVRNILLATRPRFDEDALRLHFTFEDSYFSSAPSPSPPNRPHRPSLLTVPKGL